MTGKTLDPRTDKKMPGWFSWRHQTDTAHVIARENYLALHGPVARRQRAAERLNTSPGESGATTSGRDGHHAATRTTASADNPPGTTSMRDPNARGSTSP